MRGPYTITTHYSLPETVLVLARKVLYTEKCLSPWQNEKVVDHLTKGLPTLEKHYYRGKKLPFCAK